MCVNDVNCFFFFQLVMRSLQNYNILRHFQNLLHHTLMNFFPFLKIPDFQKMQDNHFI